MAVSASLALFLFLPIALQVYFACIRSCTLKKFNTTHGCAPPRTLPSQDPIFGLGTVIHTFKSMKNHCRMRTVQVQAQTHGHTFQSFPFGRRTITTTSAKNTQTILSLSHEKFGVSPIRGPAEAMLGSGIISSDGKAWEHARGMIKPAFTRKEIANREMFDAHFQRFWGLLPVDGREVDLQPLFDRLVCLVPTLLSDCNVAGDHYVAFND
jgi:cytochrome P450